MVGTFENNAFPLMSFTYEGADEEVLQREAQRIKDFKPGDKIVQTTKPEVEVFEVNSLYI